jgi:hypothetical protein
VDLERDADEPEGEPHWELVAGPVVTMTAGRFAATAAVGLSALRRRFELVTEVGAVGHFSLNAVF